MKNTLKFLFEAAFSHWRLPLNTLLWSVKLYCLALAPYLAMCTVLLLFSILSGELFDFISFTRKYFYDGVVFNKIEMWRIHLAWFVACVLINIDKMFEE